MDEGTQGRLTFELRGGEGEREIKSILFQERSENVRITIGGLKATSRLRSSTEASSIVIHATYPIVKSFGSCISTTFPFLFLLIMGFKIQILERNAFLGKTNRSFFRLLNRMQSAV